MYRALLRLCALLTLLLPITVHAQGDTGLASEVLDFPADHRLHHNAPYTDERYVEWHYFTGILTDEETGALYGYQFTLFQFYTEQIENFVSIYHAAISDITNSRHPFYTSPPQLSGDAFITMPTGDNPTWSYDLTHLRLAHDEVADVWEIWVEADVQINEDETLPIGIELTLANDKADYYLEYPDGLAPMPGCDHNRDTLDGYTYYYTHPALTTTGTLTLGDETFAVTGDSWFDHQWGNFMGCSTRWDWFSLRMDDGSYIMLFNFRDEEGNDMPGFRGLTYISPDGEVSWWHGEEAATLTRLRYWRSPLAPDRLLTLEWILETPVGTFGLTPYFDEQTMVAGHNGPVYWEGAMRVHEGTPDGPVIGRAYVELSTGH